MVINVLKSKDVHSFGFGFSKASLCTWM